MIFNFFTIKFNEFIREYIIIKKSNLLYNALDVYKEENILYFFLIFYEKFENHQKIIINKIYLNNFLIKISVYDNFAKIFNNPQSLQKYFMNLIFEINIFKNYFKK